jgi:hypothetical protein
MSGFNSAAACFTEVMLPVPADPDEARAIEGFRVFRIECPTGSTLVPADPAARPSP